MKTILAGANGRLTFETVIEGRRVTVHLDRDTLTNLVRDLEDTPVSRCEGLASPTDARGICAPGITLKVSANANKPWLANSFSYRRGAK